MFILNIPCSPNYCLLPLRIVYPALLIAVASLIIIFCQRRYPIWWTLCFQKSTLGSFLVPKEITQLFIYLFLLLIICSITFLFRLMRITNEDTLFFFCNFIFNNYFSHSIVILFIMMYLIYFLFLFTVIVQCVKMLFSKIPFSVLKTNK